MTYCCRILNSTNIWCSFCAYIGMGSSSSINFGYKGRKWSRDTDFNSSRLPLSSCSSFNKLTTTSNHIFKHKNLASPSLLPLQRRERLGSISCTKLLRFSSITDGSSVIASRTRRRVNWKSSLPWNLTKYHEFLQINKTQKIKVLLVQNWSFLSVMSFFFAFSDERWFFCNKKNKYDGSKLSRVVCAFVDNVLFLQSHKMQWNVQNKRKNNRPTWPKCIIVWQERWFFCNKKDEYEYDGSKT